MVRLKPPPPWLVTILVTCAFLAIYTRTMAPGLLSGDSAEFQLVAVTLGVAHPTTYPLYTLLGHLATRIIPFGEPAWRVTLVSAICAALAVGAHSWLSMRFGLTRRAALFAAVLLGVSPGLWNAATLAEVYALLALLIMLAGITLASLNLGICTLCPAQRAATGERLGVRDFPSRGARFVMGLIAGLGFTHHGLFAITVLPIWVAWLFSQILRQAEKEGGNLRFRAALLGVGPSIAGFIGGMSPWLYPLIQYARFGPFTGEDYGLPRHYFWGAPTSWGSVADLLSGGTVRRGIFRIPTPNQALETMHMLAERAIFEIGWLGILVALIGCCILWRRSRTVWLASAWIVLATSTYLFLLGPAVEDAPIFTLPMIMPITLWAAYGINWLVQLPQLTSTIFQNYAWRSSGKVPQLRSSAVPTEVHTAPHLATAQTPYEYPRFYSKIAVFRHIQPIILAMALTLWIGWWADTRVEYASKRHLTLYRSFGEAVFKELPRDAVVLAHWEQGMALQYLHLAEGKRPDIWIDVVEPSDEAWRSRITRRYAERIVYLIGQAPDVRDLPVELIREDPYALLFRLRGE